jgi:hypothetical protein
MRCRIRDAMGRRTRGREKAFVGYDFSGSKVTDITRNARVSRPDASVEAYLRIGMIFGQ